MNNTQALRLRGIQTIIQLLFFVFIFSFPLLAQYENVVLNETSGDGGNIESRNDAIVELAGLPLYQEGYAVSWATAYNN